MAATKTARLSGYQGGVLSVDMYINDCPNCGVLFGITTDYEQRRRGDGKGFVCPNGHSMTFGETDVDRAQKRAKEAERKLAREAELRERYQTWLRTEREALKAERKQHAATKGKLTKTRNRANATLCPVDGCKRSFVQVRRHIAKVHPEAAQMLAELDDREPQS